ncbi:NAD-dependent DNA ligase [Anaerovibrio lipolyticus]|uniref:NAD-dependent DNA ligase n=1 Tax=Anaerovibrio lipolyticus TaxID=82374 RepID=UPI0023F1AE01|nr:NAD-dependent DNA ligase [Anaerovibrio lipolyticus]
MQELSAAVAEIRKCSELLLEVAEALTSVNESPEPPIEKITMEEVRAVLSRKAASGLSDEVKALLDKYGAKKLSDISPEDYHQLIKEAEAIGNAS